MAKPVISASEFVLDVGRYTRGVRARMLYNHLYFSEMIAADRDALLADDFFLKIIDHRNFNPRLIKLLTSPEYLAIAQKPIRSVVEAVLDSPAYLWERPYRHEFGREARALMLSLYFNEPVTSIAGLEQTFGRMLEATGSNVPVAERPFAFKSTLKQLEGSVLAIQDRKIRFSNPGVRDFLDRVMVDDRFLPSAAQVLSDYSELKQCWSSYKRSPKSATPGFPSIWSDAIERMLQSDTGTALQRLELVIESFDVLHDIRLLTHVSSAAVDVATAEIGDNEADLCRSLLESVSESALPPDYMVRVRDAVSEATASLLKLWGGCMGLDDLDNVAGTLVEFGTKPSDATVAIHVALTDFIRNIDEVLREFDDVDELDDFEIDLNRAMTRYSYANSRVERDIEYRRDAILEGRVLRHQSHYGSLQRSDEKPDVSDDEIRSMFRGFPK